ncbi:pyrroline-5-carboxylate reductase [Alkalicoccus urumqiensis]|uniref:Pyrroline-5-carboxylate reductase n=1 Tax=Alkalicoccus urumqiensis TaxID=1548213 RepID=A0A2P6MGF4_ALKUR|nr:pyrroline-5-carboxylate reductase [Alkalicoccus urumqiensis]PRO65372.1 pyrroline-5-carboxylate reductase [Alkalicoccus urumqiensis]
MEKWNVLFIGAGRMAEAVISGIVKKQPEEIGTITAANRSDLERLQFLQDKYGITVTTDWLRAVKEQQMIILAAPPKAHDSLLKAVRPFLTNQVVVTVAAGIDPAYMEGRLPEGTPVCWVMPNTAAQVGMSMTTHTYGAHIRPEHKPYIEAVLEAIGPAEEMSAEQVHHMTAITGSAPAFIYYMAQALEEAAVSYDVTGEQARRLVSTMMQGAARMLSEGKSPEALMEEVASPGGSTAEGLHVLETYEVDKMIRQAVDAVNRHAAQGGKS